VFLAFLAFLVPFLIPAFLFRNGAFQEPQKRSLPRFSVPGS
jgi:hypothetical protein